MSAKLLLNSEVSIPEAILRVLEEAGIDPASIPGEGSSAFPGGKQAAFSMPYTITNPLSGRSSFDKKRSLVLCLKCMDG